MPRGRYANPEAFFVPMDGSMQYIRRNDHHAPVEGAAYTNSSSHQHTAPSDDVNTTASSATTKQKRPAEVARFLRKFETKDRLDVCNALLSLGLHHYQQMTGGEANLHQLVHTSQQVRRLPAFHFANAPSGHERDAMEAREAASRHRHRYRSGSGGRTAGRSSSQEYPVRNSGRSASAGLRQFLDEERHKMKQHSNGHYSPGVIIRDGPPSSSRRKPESLEVSAERDYSRANSNGRTGYKQQQSRSQQREQQWVDGRNNVAADDSASSTGTDEPPYGHEVNHHDVNRVQQPAGTAQSIHSSPAKSERGDAKETSRLEEQKSTTTTTLMPSSLNEQQVSGHNSTPEDALSCRQPSSPWTVSSQSRSQTQYHWGNTSQCTSAVEAVLTAGDPDGGFGGIDGSFMFPAPFVEDLNNVVKSMNGTRASPLIVAARMAREHANLTARKGFQRLYRSALINYHVNAGME